MDHPVAFRLTSAALPTAHRVSLDPATISALQERAMNGPAVIVAREAAMIVGMKAGVVDPASVVAVANGDWSNAVLILLGDEHAPLQSEGQVVGDAAFVAQVERSAPALAKLAADTIQAIRGAGIDGDLVEAGGRWVNRPLNTFTLKAQPRAGNLHFTLYGNPQTYEADGFLLQDQNSYSRGWVESSDDAQKLAQLARQSHARRKR